jgi:hypothetical protein
MKKQWYSHIIVVVLLHIAAWTIVFMLPYFLRPDIPPVKDVPISRFFRWINLLQYVFLAAIFYFNAYWLIPRLLNRKKYFLYLACLLVVVAAGYFLNFGRVRYLRQPFEKGLVVAYRADGPQMRPPGFGQRDVHIRVMGPVFPSLFSLLFVLAFSIAYRFFLDKMTFDRIQQERQTEHLRSELSFLRSQISPHFIFNVLNSAVSLARTQPVQVEPTLLKLSGLMRYMLYDTDDTKVALNQELEYLESYIELQKLRFGDLVKIQFSKSGVLSGYAIEPMLLIPFVENAFKHGMGKINDPEIIIALEELHGILYFYVKNRYNPGEETVQDKYSGIGLVNVSKRLDLLYGSSYHLNVMQTADWYEVKLKLPLQ